MREGLFINSVLVNADVWINLTKKEINELTVVDNALVRMIWECPSFTSIPVIFLELGIKPIKFYLIQRRLMYYHYLLNQSPDSLLYKCFSEQCSDPLPGDWILQVREDCKVLEINMSSEEIKQLSKVTFQKFVKGRIEKLAFDWLIKEKNKQSKCASISYEKLQMQDYLTSNKFTTHQKKFLLQIRTARHLV